MNEGPAAGGDGFEDDGFGEEDETFGNDPMANWTAENTTMERKSDLPLSQD